MSEAIDYRTSHTTGAISITGVSKRFGKHKALDDVSLSLAPGSVTVILGPSGLIAALLIADVVAINLNKSFVDPFQMIDGAQQRGFTGAGRPEDPRAVRLR